MIFTIEIIVSEIPLKTRIYKHDTVFDLIFMI